MLSIFCKTLFLVVMLTQDCYSFICATSVVLLNKLVRFVEMNDMNCLIVKLSNLEQASHNTEGLKQRLKGLCECKESSMHAHGDSHQFSKLRIPRCL